MQTIHINVDDAYVTKIINILENLKGVMLEDFKLDKTVEKDKELMNAQISVMSKTWENDKDKEWDEL